MDEGGGGSEEFKGWLVITRGKFWSEDAQPQNQATETGQE